MRGLKKALFTVVSCAILGGIVFVALWDVPAPSKTTEITIPDSRFQQ